MEKLHLTLAIEQEIRVQMTLYHQNIVRVKDTYFTEDFIILVLEYCSNGDLYTFIKEHNSISDSAVKRFFYQIVSAVCYLHSKKIFHKDIKPENILLNDYMECKLADFRCLQTSIRNFQPERFASVEYAPPEFFLQQKPDGLKFDVWSLGILLYVLYAGQTPWINDDFKDNINDVINANINYTFIPLEAVDFLKYILVPNPLERPSLEDLINTEYFKSCELTMNPIRSSRQVNHLPPLLLKGPQLPLSSTCRAAEKKKDCFQVRPDKSTFSGLLLVKKNSLELTSRKPVRNHPRHSSL